MRIEHDFLGEMELDDASLFGIQTLRGVGASGVTGHSFGQDGMTLIRAIAMIKKAAALANLEVGGLDRTVAGAICKAADEVIAGRWNDQFPVDLITGGGGVSVHMNVNEVLAHRASAILSGLEVHPNTHVNMGQSTNDVLPSAMLLAAHELLEEVCAAVEELAEVSAGKEEEFRDTVKLGRTCLQDALPVTLGQTFSAWVSFLRRQKDNLKRLAADCLELPLGGTAVGTGAGSLPGFKKAVFARLKELSGLEVRAAENCFDAMQFGDIHIHISSALKALSAGLSKMGSDLRLLSSGPKGGMGELILPAVLPGSSIMPGKINPILPELVMQVHFLVCGNDAAVTMAVERGELELNVWEAVVTRCTLDSCRLLSRSIVLFARRCVAGVKADVGHCREEAEKSTALAAMIAAVFGYEAGSRVAREALSSGRSIREVAVDMGLLGEEAAAELLDPARMTDGEQMAQAIAEARNRYSSGPRG